MPKITFTHILVGAAIAGAVWYVAKPKQPEPEQETTGFDWIDWNEYLETEYTIDTITDMISDGWEDLKDLID